MRKIDTSYPPCVLCPLAVISNSLILLHEDDSPHRRTLCAVLIVSRMSLIFLYFNVLISSYCFRLFLLLYADRGLVKNCQPNLGLFCQLYWVVVAVFLVFISAYGLGVNLIKGNFILQDLNRGRACLLGNIPDYSVEVQYTKKAITYALIASAFIRLVYFKFKVKRFITGLCPIGKVHSFSKIAVTLEPAMRF